MVILKPPTLSWWSQCIEWKAKWKKQKRESKQDQLLLQRWPSGSKDQITRLMAALTRVEQGSCPASAPNSPRHRGHGRGQVDRNTPVYPSSHNGQTGLGQTASIHSSSATNKESAESQQRGNIQAQNGAQGGAQSTRDSNTLQCSRCQGWGHMVRECTTPAKTLNKDGGTQGNAVEPPPTTHSKFTTFPLWP